MACLKVRDLNGVERLEPEDQNGVVHTVAGDEILGPVWDCGPSLNASPQVDVELEREGIPWGDAIAWVTKKIGVKQCAPCKARQEILNHAAQNGWAETMRQIRETFKG